MNEAHAERYFGETRALRGFLREVGRICENEEFLAAKIRQAVKAGDLRSLRAARTAFYQYPKDFRGSVVMRMFQA